MRTLDPARRQVNMIETVKREHSRKPDEAYELIEACSPGPYLEMFARYPTAGVDGLGRGGGGGRGPARAAVPRLPRHTWGGGRTRIVTLLSETDHAASLRRKI